MVSIGNQHCQMEGLTMSIQSFSIDLVAERPPCDQKGCTTPAKYSVVWTKRQNYCEEHIAKILKVAQVMGYPTPHATLGRIVTADEFDPMKSSNDYE
jgi:hypothetical protein